MDNVQDITLKMEKDFLQGKQGPQGEPNTLTIGIVEKGEKAGASIEGEAPNQVLNLILPKGDKGDAGPQGEPGNIDNISQVFTGTSITAPTIDGYGKINKLHGTEAGVSGDIEIVSVNSDATERETKVISISTTLYTGDYIDFRKKKLIKDGIEEDISLSDLIRQFPVSTAYSNNFNAEMEIEVTENTKMSNINKDLDFIQGRTIAVSPTEPTTNEKVWFQTSTKKISVRNDDGEFAEYINAEIANNLQNYSTEEQRIGTYINGKPLYRKFVTFQNGVTTENGTYPAAPNMVQIGTNIDFCILEKGWFFLTLSQKRQFLDLPYTNSAGYLVKAIIDVSNNGEASIGATSNGTSFNSVICYGFVLYTKTTD